MLKALFLFGSVSVASGWLMAGGFCSDLNWSGDYVADNEAAARAVQMGCAKEADLQTKKSYADDKIPDLCMPDIYTTEAACDAWNDSLASYVGSKLCKWSGGKCVFRNVECPAEWVCAKKGDSCGKDFTHADNKFSAAARGGQNGEFPPASNNYIGWKSDAIVQCPYKSTRAVIDAADDTCTCEAPAPTAAPTTAPPTAAPTKPTEWGPMGGEACTTDADCQKGFYKRTRYSWDKDEDETEKDDLPWSYLDYYQGVQKSTCVESKCTGIFKTGPDALSNFGCTKDAHCGELGSKCLVDAVPTFPTWGERVVVWGSKGDEPKGRCTECGHLEYDPATEYCDHWTDPDKTAKKPLKKEGETCVGTDPNNDDPVVLGCEPGTYCHFWWPDSDVDQLVDVPKKKCLKMFGGAVGDACHVKHHWQCASGYCRGNGNGVEATNQGA